MLWTTITINKVEPKLNSSCQITQSLVTNRSDINAFEDEIICHICQNIILEPTQCVECQNSFCKQCITNWFKKSSTCPFRCKTSEMKENKLLKRLLSKLKLSCPFKCGKIISYEDFANHTTNVCSQRPSQSTSITFDEVENLRKKIKKMKQIVQLFHLRQSKRFFKVPDKFDPNSLKSCQIKISKHKHPLTAMITNRAGWSCDICEKYGGQHMSYYCSLCDFDCCEQCYKLEKVILTILYLSKTPNK